VGDKGLAELLAIRDGSDEMPVEVEARTTWHPFVALRVDPWLGGDTYHLKPGWARQLAEVLLTAVEVTEGAEPPAFLDAGAGI